MNKTVEQTIKFNLWKEGYDDYYWRKSNLKETTIPHSIRHFPSKERYQWYVFGFRAAELEDIK